MVMKRRFDLRTAHTLELCIWVFKLRCPLVRQNWGFFFPAFLSHRESMSPREYRKSEDGG